MCGLTYNLNQWTCLGLVFDQSPKQISMYKDGTLVEKTPFTGIPDEDGLDILTLADRGFPRFGWDASHITLDELVMFNVDLTQDQVHAICNK